MRWLIAGLGAGFLLGGCLHPLPGSENVRLLKNTSSVQDAESVGSKTGSTDREGLADLSVIAKNYAVRHKADIVVVTIQPRTPAQIDYTIEAWRSNPPAR
jgi:hypothetical protein